MPFIPVQEVGLAGFQPVREDIDPRKKYLRESEEQMASVKKVEEAVPEKLRPAAESTSKIALNKVLMPMISPEKYKGTNIPKMGMHEVLTAGLSYPAKAFPLKELGAAQTRESSGSARVMQEWGKAISGQTFKPLTPIRVRGFWRQGLAEADEGHPYSYEQLFNELGYNPGASKALSVLGNAVGTPSGYLYLMAVSPSAYKFAKYETVKQIRNAKEITFEVGDNINRAIKQGVLDRKAIMELKRTLDPRTFDKISRLSREMYKIVKTTPEYTAGAGQTITGPTANIPGVQQVVKPIELGPPSQQLLDQAAKGVKVTPPKIAVKAVTPQPIPLPPVKPEIKSSEGGEKILELSPAQIKQMGNLRPVGGMAIDGNSLIMARRAGVIDFDLGDISPNDNVIIINKENIADKEYIAEHERRHHKFNKLQESQREQIRELVAIELKNPDSPLWRMVTFLKGDAFGEGEGGYSEDRIIDELFARGLIDKQYNQIVKSAKEKPEIPEWVKEWAKEGEKKFKPVKEVEPSAPKIPQEEKDLIMGMKSEIERGEAGKRIKTETGEWIGQGSTFPQWFRDAWTNLTKKKALDIIDKKEKGEKLTEKQEQIYKNLSEGYGNEERIREEREQLRKEKVSESEIEKTLRAGEAEGDPEGASKKDTEREPEWVTEKQPGESEEKPLRAKHFTTKEGKEALERGERFDFTKKPIHGTGSLGGEEKLGRFAGDRIYLSLEDRIWGKTSIREGEDKIVEVGGLEHLKELKKAGAETFYDYDKQKWMAKVGAKQVIKNLESVEYEIDKGAKIKVVDSIEAYREAEAEVGHPALHQEKEFFDALAKKYDAVVFKNVRKIAKETDHKFFKAILADQIIVLNEDKARIVKPSLAPEAKMSPTPLRPTEEQVEHKDLIKELKAEKPDATQKEFVFEKGKIVQKEKVKEAVKEEPKSIKQIAKETEILEPNVRRIVGVGAKEGTFKRVGKGVYVLRNQGRDVAYIHTGDALEIVPKLVDQGFKADMIFLDVPYKTPAVIGGNRGIKYDYITPEQFYTMVERLGQVMRTSDTPLIYMYSQAKSGLKEMQRYTDVFNRLEMIAVGKGEYTKLQKDGITRVRNMRGDIIEPEGIIVFNFSGKLTKPIKNLNFKLVRPRGYQTEKPRKMLKAMIEMTTEQGEVVFDPFAGSGVTIEQAVATGRKGVGVEISEKAVEEHIKPRVEKAAETPSKEMGAKAITDKVPDVNNPNKINYWEGNVYVEGWCDKCYAGTGFGEYEAQEKVNYAEDMTPKILQQKAKEKGLELIGGEFVETPDKDFIYGVTVGFYKKPVKGGGAGGSSVASKAPKGYGTIESKEEKVRITDRVKVEAGMPPPERINYIKEFLKILSPASVSNLAQVTSQVMRGGLAKLAHKDVTAIEALKKAHRAFTWMNKEDSYKFIDNMEKGLPQENEKLQAFSDVMRKLLDERRESVQNLGKGQLQNFYKNYFPHIWERFEHAKGVIAKIMGKKRLEGTKGFLKERTYMTIKEGLEAGLTPVSNNPVDLVLLKLHEVDRYVMAQNVIRDLKNRGMIRFVYSRKTPPQGFAKINDTAFTVYMPPEITKKEAFDSILVEQLMDVAKSLEIDTKRFVTIGGTRWGYAQWPSTVRTKFASPESVLAHEIGHILGYRFNLFNTFTAYKDTYVHTYVKGKKVGTEEVKPTKEAIEWRKNINEQWRALADARYKGIDAPASYKNYVRKYREKEAVLLEALIHAPEEFKKLAPDIYELFTKFLNEHGQLRPILDIRPSLVLGEADAKIKIPGFTTLGHYYAPKDVALIINNHLSPGLRTSDNKLIATGYNLVRGFGNILNQVNLSLSAFHGLNVTTDVWASTVGLGLRKLTIKGQLYQGLKDLITFPIAPIKVLWEGSRIKRAYKQQMDTIQDPKLRLKVDTMIRAGGRDRIDVFYYNQQIKALQKTFKDILVGSGIEKIAAMAKLPLNIFGSILETAAKPIMEWYVPTGKLGLFSKLAQSEMERAASGEINDEQLWYMLTKVWDSVDNRMGSLIYDNLFWNKTLKDVLMASVRSVGWNLGSWREYGGIPVDLGTAGARIRAGDKLLSHKMAYGIGAMIVYMIIGAIATYVLSGERPREIRDYFFPRTGRKNPDGSDERLSLPTYAKDIYAYATRPLQTFVSKRHPLIGLSMEQFRNKDFYNVMLYDEKDGLMEQLYDRTIHIKNYAKPFSFKNYERMQLTSPDPLLNILLSITGIIAAPSYVARSNAQKLMYRYISERMPDTTRTEADFAKTLYRKVQKDRIRKGEVRPWQIKEEAIEVLGRDGYRKLAKDSRLTPFVESFKRLTLEEGLNVYSIATDDERKEILPVLRKKYRDADKPIEEDVKALYMELKISP